MGYKKFVLFLKNKGLNYYTEDLKFDIYDSTEEMARTIVIKQLRLIKPTINGVNVKLSRNKLGIKFNMSRANSLKLGINYAPDNNDYVPLDL